MTSFNFVIRDAIEADIEACLILDHSYETDYVWQMTISPQAESWQIIFKKERLPRSNEILYPIDETRLRLALPPEMCYLVAAGKDEPIMLGYLTMRPQVVHQIALIQDIIVSRQFRKHGVGSRLLAVARRWAQEHGAQQLLVETRTRNYPAIEFLQSQGLSFCGFNDQYFRNQDIAVFFGQSLR
jgi:ribosomal protein S18 acetylase RimI-like enzyme